MENKGMSFKKKKISSAGDLVSPQKWFSSDEQFSQLLPAPMQELSYKHWTPLAIAKKATRFLSVWPGCKTLDIGSGIGKFCLAAAHFEPAGLFYGVEQRKDLVWLADATRKKLEMENVFFIHGNFTQIDFSSFDNFYFFNSFYENLTGTDKIDNNLEYSGELYNYYSSYLFRQLERKPPGTRLVTYHSNEDEIPANYHEVGNDADQLLKFWVKV